MIRDNGGPAFPMIRDITHNPDWDIEEGMSMRDWFAGQALNGLTSDPDCDVTESGSQTIARFAYRYADAMIAERSKCGE